MLRCELQIINKLGLHARAATKLASAAGHYQCSIRIGAPEQSVDAKSIMSLMLLAASQGTDLSFEFDGPDELQAQQEIAQLLANYFGEGE